MTDPAQARSAALAARIALVSAAAMFVLAVALWNRWLPFDPGDDARPMIVGALLAAGLLDLGIGIMMRRRSR
jgi:peptidoglycan/LPS O-acetylase OafA/YrhL